MGTEEKLLLDKKPMVLVFAGPNGSGKSTIKAYFNTVGEYTNADEMVAATGMSNEDAAKEADRKRYESISKKADFSFETVLSSHYKMDLLRKAKEEGYFIKCIFVLTKSPYLNVARVMARAEQGGHSVDPEKVISRYWKSLANIPELLKICDILHVYDNSGVEPEEIRRIVRKHKESITIFPSEEWTEEEILRLIGIKEDGKK